MYRALSKEIQLPAPEYAAVLRPLIGLTPEQVRTAWEHATKLANGGRITTQLVRAAAAALQFRPEAREKSLALRQARAQRRQQLTQTMADLLQMIVLRKPYEDLAPAASLLDQHLRFFFPKKATRGQT